MSYGPSEWDPDVDFDGWYTTVTGERIGNRLDDMRARQVLEVGCATGLMTTRLVARSRQILAVTLNDDMAARARERNLRGVEVIAMDVLRITGPPTFDAIVCASVLHEVGSPQAMLRKFRELLVDDGVVFVTVPSANSLHFAGQPEFSVRAERYGVQRLLTGSQWHDVLTDGTGLRVAEYDEMMCKPYPNEVMACLSPTMLAWLAGYRGPGGALCWFELEAE